MFKWFRERIKKKVRDDKWKMYQRGFNYYSEFYDLEHVLRRLDDFEYFVEF